MKYIWIVMLIIVEIIWFVFSLKDFIETAKQYKIKYILDSLEAYTVGFIFFNLCLLFSYSLGLFIKGLG